MANLQQENKTLILALIGNIPPDYHSADLRRFFSEFIENEGFQCFHFRHRPEGENPLKNDKDPQNTDVENSSATKLSKTSSKLKDKKKTCCIVKLTEDKYIGLIQVYHKKHWTDKNAKTIPSLCFISKIKVAENVQEPQCPSPGEQSDPVPPGRDVGRGLTSSDLAQLMELNPPAMMPNGNVGTPSRVFLDLIKACRLPPKIIGKLGLTFPKSRARRIYANVKLDYSSLNNRGRKRAVQSEGSASEGNDGNGESSKVSQDSEGSNNGDKNQEKDTSSPAAAEENVPKLEDKVDEDLEKKDSEPESEDDADDCEEWERHEALHDDAANVERNKERAYEEPLEVVWEKGGPGLVWYTDEVYWRQQQGDFDEQTADDWDVDMSVYYEAHGGDRDSRELVTMRRERRRRQGLGDDDPNIPDKIGKFEKHTKGVGRRVLEQQGWRDGQGLGASTSGISDALHNDGQKPVDKTGFGYHGEKLRHYAPVSGASRRPRRRDNADDVIISTVYDNTDDMEIPDTLLRRTDHNAMKYSTQRKVWRKHDKS